MKVFDNFSGYFQKGGVPFLIFLGFVFYLALKVLDWIIPDIPNADDKAREEVIEAVKNQVGVSAITTQDRLIASRIHNACNGFFKDTSAMEEIAKYFTTNTITKRVFSAYGIRETSKLWFDPVRQNMVEAIFAQYGSSSEIGKKYQKILSNANLA